jgi:FAD:protein FMN transferase
MAVFTSVPAALLAALVCAEPKLERREFNRLLMGVRARVVVYAASDRDAEAGARAAFDRIAALEDVMSDWRDDSEASRLAAGATGAAVPVSDDLARVLGHALDVARASGGAFDPTVGPLVALWREARSRGRLPDARAIEDARARVGFERVVLDEKARTVRLDCPGTRLDFGGIGKGFAASEAVAVLRDRGVARCLVALAGDVAAGDAPPGESGWRIAVRTGLDGAGEGGSIALANAAVSTSGDAEQFVEIGGVRYSHVVDPRTGLGVERRVAACVVAPDGAIADALATALCVRGAAAAEEIVANFPGAAARVDEERDGAVVRTRTAGFPPLSGR